MKGRSNALLEVGDTFAFNGLRNGVSDQKMDREARLRIDGISVAGDLDIAVSAGPDEPFRLGVFSVPILTALHLIETNVWEEASP